LVVERRELPFLVLLGQKKLIFVFGQALFLPALMQDHNGGPPSFQMTNNNSPYIHSYETQNLLEQQESIINALRDEIDALRRKDWQNEREISQLRMNEMKLNQEIQYLKLSLLAMIKELSKTQPTTPLQLNNIAIDSGINIEESVMKGILHGDYQIGLKYDASDSEDGLTNKDPWCDMFLL
jgi:hypothetical protein